MPFTYYQHPRNEASEGDEESFFFRRDYTPRNRDDASWSTTPEEPPLPTTTTTPHPCSILISTRQWCFTGLATVLWLSLLIQFVAVLLSLIRQNVTCGWNRPSEPPQPQHGGGNAFCLALLQHPIMEGLILALYLAVLWLAMSLTYMLVAWFGKVCCQSSSSTTTTSWQQGFPDEEQQYPPIYYSHNNTVTTLSYWSNSRSNRRHTYPLRHVISQVATPTVASSTWEDSGSSSSSRRSDQDSDELTPLIVYLV